MNPALKIWQTLSFEHKKKSLILFILIIFTTALEVIGIGLILPVIIFLLEEDVNSKYPELINFISFFHVDIKNNNLIIFSLIILLSVYFLKNLFLAFFSFFESKFSWGVQANLRRRLFNYYLNEKLSFHNKKNSGFLINNITKEITQFTFVLVSYITIFSELLILLSISILLIIYQPISFFIAAICCTFFLFIYYILTADKIKILGKKRHKEDGLLITKIQQSIGGIREVKIYSGEKIFLDFFDISNNELYKVSWLNQFIIKLPKLILEFSIITAMVVLVIITLKINTDKNYIILILGLFAFAAMRLIPSISRIYGSIQTIKFGLPSVNTLFEELRDSKKNTNNNITLAKSKTHKDKKMNFNNEIKINNMSFSYIDNEIENEVLNKINLSISKGEFIGISGKSGSGKSTLVDIILGLQKPTVGRVLVDDVDIQNNLLGWHSNISYVPQNVFLIDDKLTKNIAFGEKAQQINAKVLKESLSKSELNNFVNTLPKKLETIVGERGSKISGGQRQRVGLARAFYHDPDLLVLDEATNSLDKETEEKIIQTILNIKGKRTVILISHEEDILKICDSIYKIENKNIIKMK